MEQTGRHKEVTGWKIRDISPMLKAKESKIQKSGLAVHCLFRSLMCRKEEVGAVPRGRGGRQPGKAGGRHSWRSPGEEVRGTSSQGTVLCDRHYGWRCPYSRRMLADDAFLNLGVYKMLWQLFE